MRERESLFNEYLIEVRRKEKEEKSQRREQVSNGLYIKLRSKDYVFASYQNYLKKMLTFNEICVYGGIIQYIT